MRFADASRVPTAVAVLLLAAGPTGCSSLPFGQRCTLIGCSDGVFEEIDSDAFRPRAQARVEMCVDERCFVADGPLRARQPLTGGDGPDRLTVTFSPGELFLEATLDTTPYRDQADRAFSLTVTVDGDVVEDRSGTIQFIASSPNGERCEPTCWQGQITCT